MQSDGRPEDSATKAEGEAPADQQPAKGAPYSRAGARKKGGQRPYFAGPAGVLLAGGVVLGIVIGATYAGRRVIFREALVGWLEARGIEADLQIDRLDPAGLSGRLVIGPADRPALVVERVEAAYSLRAPWSRRGAGVDLEAVRLVRPRLAGGFRNGELDLGPLDPLIEEILKRPRDPDAPEPLILVQDGRAAIQTDYGALGVRADARIDQGKLMWLDARLDPARIRLGEARFLVDGGRLGVATRADRMAIQASLLVAEGQMGEARARRAVMRLEGEAAYPDVETRRADGDIRLRLEATADEAGSGGGVLRGVQFTSEMTGRLSGWIDTLRAEGPVKADLAVREATLHQAHARRISVGGQGAGAWSRDGWRLAARLSARGDGSIELGPRGPAQPHPEIASIRKAAEAFRLQASSLALVAGSGLSTTLSLAQPLRVQAQNGAVLQIASVAGAPIYQDGRGAFQAAVSGPDLPDVTGLARAYSISDGALRAKIAITGSGDMGPLQQAKLSTSGSLFLAPSGATYVQTGCAPVSAQKVEMEAVTLADLATRLCAARGPLLKISGQRWTSEFRVMDLASRLVEQDAQLSGLEAALSVSGGPRGISGQATLAGVRITDLAREPRFAPLRATGAAKMAGDALSGQASLSLLSSGAQLGDISLGHDLARGAGQAKIAAPSIVFSKDGLQPGDISPMAASLGSSFQGAAGFTGSFRWREGRVDSDGVASLADISFSSAAGMVEGLSGNVRLTSLAPPTSAPDQILQARRIDTLAPLSGIEVAFRLRPDRLEVARATASSGGGSLRLAPMSLRFDASPVEGRLEVQGVQLHDVVERSPFADHVSLQARVTGDLPFVVAKQGVRIINGRLKAIEPGRLSIRREALSGLQAQGGQAAAAEGAPAAATPAAPPNTVTEFAFQALENLAFSELSAEVNSLPQGRLGVLFMIHGEHDPPQERQLRIGLGDLIGGKLMHRQLPLPSHTKVNLTLDTSINLDQILSDFAETQRRRGSAAVQP